MNESYDSDDEMMVVDWMSRCIWVGGYALY